MTCVNHNKVNIDYLPIVLITLSLAIQIVIQVNSSLMEIFACSSFVDLSNVNMMIVLVILRASLLVTLT